MRQAERRLGRCRRLLEAVGHRQDLARVHLFLALVYCRQGEERRARRHLQRMADLVEALGYSHFLHPELARMPELSALATRAGMALPFVAPQREDVPGARSAVLATMQPIPTARLPEVRAQAFGTIQVWRDGRPLPGTEWRSQKAEELFFYLLVHGSAHKEQVMEALWPDSDPGRAQTNLHTSAYRVRRAIHPSAVLFERGRYLINPDLPCWHDAAAFDALLEEARRLPRGSAERIDLLRRAVDLYRGPYLPGWYADWCEERRRYYEERCLSSLVEVAGYHRARGEHAESLAFYQRVLDIDPLHDEVHERVIEAYLTLGDGISALHHYQRYVDLLRRELGVEPGPRLAALHRRITRGDAVAR
ncbi:MAG TPA: BTAD domain-containing putative transcriptional regulator [Chloroflexota bacterium]